jgi:Glycosyltransferase like family
MIAFGTSITSPAAYRRFAQPGIERAAELDSVVFPFAAAGSIFRSYNLLLDKAAELDDLEALVLVHQDAEITDEDLCRKLREALSDPDVGVVGCVGAIGVRSIAWWEGSVTWASFIHRYGEHGGGDLPAFAWATDDLPPYARTGEVDTVDGFLMGLSPWVVRNVRFDESLGQLHGYDFDFCLQVRAAGKKVVTTDFRAIHNHSLELVSNHDTWVETHMRIAEKWDGRMGVGLGGDDWKLRARRAEAESEAGRAAAVSTQLQADARELELQRALDATTQSLSWRMTAPLRKLNEWRRAGAAWRRRRDGR